MRVDSVAWRKRVDKKLNELQARMDQYEAKLASENALIHKKLDTLIAETSEILSWHRKARGVRRVVFAIGRGIAAFLRGSSTVSLGLVGLLTAGWVIDHAHSLRDAWEMFIQVFNGTTKGG